MTVEEMKNEIKRLDREARQIGDKAITSLDVEEVKACNKQLTEIRQKRNDLEDMIEKASSEIPSDAKLVDYGIRSGDAHFSYGSSEASKDNSSLILRSNESLVSRLSADARKPLDLGKCIRGLVTGDWTNALEERSAISTTATGVLIPQILSGQIIDMARSLSLFTTSGVPVVPMLSNNMTIARVKTDPVFAFKEELAQASESSFELEPVQLSAKTAYGYAYCSLEAIRSAENLTDILYTVFSQAFADMCDRAMLYGQESSNALVDYAPSGILNDEDINTITATNVGYADFIKAIGAIKRANGIPTVVGMNAATEEQLALLTDNNFNVLNPPEAFSALTKIVSNQLLEDETDGSDAIVFDPKAMIIGVQNNITIRMITDSDYCLKNGAVGFQIYAMLDCAVTQPKHISKISGLKETESDDNNG